VDAFWHIPLLLFAGLFAGMIDSIAGGGGLITVPLLTLLIGPGPLAIGTNKVAAVGSSLFALLVYMKAGHVELKGNRIFAALVGVGAVCGAFLSSLIPPSNYQYILILICPVILFVVFKKDLWIRQGIDAVEIKSRNQQILFCCLGFACGLYDGIAGPGGGTLMFLSLYLVARIPLLAAMATAKVANLASASLALGSFAFTGNVQWVTGLWLAAGISVGALIGANYATRNAAPLARLALLIVAVILLIRLLTVL
jgi:uncharacterized membrane protein YfcA